MTPVAGNPLPFLTYKGTKHAYKQNTHTYKLNKFFFFKKRGGCVCKRDSWPDARARVRLDCPITSLGSLLSFLSSQLTCVLGAQLGCGFLF